MNPTLKTSLLLSVFLSAGLAQTATAGMHDREGMYFGVDLGVAISDDVELNGSDDDVPTRCDQVLRQSATPADQGSQFSDLTVATLASGGDCERGQDVWGSEVDMGTGIIAGFQAGYLLGDFRAEIEYLYRAHAEGERKSLTGLTTKTGELVSDQQGLDNISSHSLFANLYYDVLSNSRFTPYVGAGIGISKIDYTYDAVFGRNTDPAVLRANNAPAAAAGTTTDTNDELSDEVFGWQFMVGSDYAIDENWSIGLKLRYQHFDNPKDSSRWDQLRGNPDSTIAEGDELRAIRNTIPDFDPTVTYHIELDDLEVWAASLNLKYAF